MRVMQLIHSLRRGGAERTVLEVSLGLRRKGHDIRIVCLLDHSEYKEDIYQECTPSALLPKDNYRWPYSVPHLARALRREIQKFGPHVLVIHTPTAAVVASFARLKVPSIHFLHGYGIFRLEASLKAMAWRTLQRWAFRRLHRRIAVVGSGMQDIAAKFFGCTSDAVHCVRNGVNIALFPFRERSLKGDPVITMLGTLSPVKHPEHGLQGLKRLLRTRPGSRLRFVGNGVMRASLEAEARALEVDSCVDWLGRRADVATLLAESHLLWHLSESEGLPLAVAEAMATGLPVVGYDVRGVREVVANDSTGCLVPFGDIDAVVSRSLVLLSHTELYQTFSRSSRLRVEAEFPLHKTVLAHEKLLMKLATPCSVVTSSVNY